jgi:hypothetical protein
MKATSVHEYIASLPQDCKPIIEDLVSVVEKNLPAEFQQRLSYGMIGWVVPHRIYPKGYHATSDLPLPFINLPAQKNYISLYHMELVEGPLLDWFKESWMRTCSVKLDMGKSVSVSGNQVIYP